MRRGRLGRRFGSRRLDTQSSLQPSHCSLDGRTPMLIRTQYRSTRPDTLLHLASFCHSFCDIPITIIASAILHQGRLSSGPKYTTTGVPTNNQHKRTTRQTDLSEDRLSVPAISTSETGLDVTQWMQAFSTIPFRSYHPGIDICRQGNQQPYIV